MKKGSPESTKDEMVVASSSTYQDIDAPVGIHLGWYSIFMVFMAGY
jgi:hypothetical protein